LSVYVDGRLAAHAPRLERIEARIDQAAAPSAPRPIDQAVSLTAAAFPKASASVNTDPAAVRQAIDGRVQFFPDAPNGWSTLGSRQSVDWYAVDFGRPIEVGAAELSFLVDSRFALPESYKLQTWRDQAWVDLAPSAPASPLRANGVTRLSWTPQVSDKLRVVFTHKPGSVIKLVELKVF
jgi:hypothetical protein